MEKTKLHLTQEMFNLKDNLFTSQTPKNNTPYNTIGYQKKQRSIYLRIRKNKTEIDYSKQHSNEFKINKDNELNIDVKPINNARDLNLEFKKYKPFKKEKSLKPIKLINNSKLPKMKKEYLEKVNINDYHIKPSDIIKDRFDINQHLIILRNHMLYTFYLEQMSKVVSYEKGSSSVNDIFVLDEIECDLTTYPHFQESMLFNAEGLLRSIGTGSVNSFQNKKPVFKEVKTNEFFYRILDKISRNITYLKENNHQVGIVTVFNLMYDEIKTLKNKFSELDKNKLRVLKNGSKTMTNFKESLKEIKEEIDSNKEIMKVNKNLSKCELIGLHNMSFGKSLYSRKNTVDSGNVTTFNSTQANYFRRSKNTSSNKFSRNYDKYQKENITTGNSNMILTEKNKTTETSESKFISSDNIFEKNLENTILNTPQYEKKLSKNNLKNDSKKNLLNSLKKNDHFNSKHIKKIKAKNIYKGTSKNNNDQSNFQSLTTNIEKIESKTIKSGLSKNSEIEKKDDLHINNQYEKHQIIENHEKDISKDINIIKDNHKEDKTTNISIKTGNNKQNEDELENFNLKKTVTFSNSINNQLEQEKAQIKEKSDELIKKVSFSVQEELKVDVNQKTSIKDKSFKLALKPTDQDHKINKKIKESHSIRKSRKSNNFDTPIFDEIPNFNSVQNEQNNSESHTNLNNIENNLDTKKSRKSFLRLNVLANINNNDNNNLIENSANTSLTPSPLQSKKSTGKIDENILRTIKEDNSSNSNRESIINQFQKRNSMIYKFRKQSQLGINPILLNQVFANEKEKNIIEAQLKLLDDNLSNNQIEEFNDKIKKAKMLMMHKLKQDITNNLNNQEISDLNSEKLDEMLNSLQFMKLDINSYLKNIDDDYMVINDEIENMNETKDIEHRINDFLYYLKDYRIKKRLLMNTFEKSFKVLDNRPKNKLCPILSKEEFNKTK